MPDNVYRVYSSELTDIADAIRAKGGTSSPLEFPDDFIDAIGAISGGGTPEPADDELPPPIADDGKVHIMISFPENTPSNRMTMQIRFTQDSWYSVLVDWGDNQTETFASSGTVTATHTYSAIGDYDITLKATSGTLNFLTYIYGDQSTINDRYRNLIDQIYFFGTVSVTAGASVRDSRKVRRVVFPDSVTSIGTQAFYNCTSLQEVTIPDSVTSIGAGAFQNCYSLREATIPDSVTSIGNQAFYVCYSLREVTIPDSVTSVGDYVFGSCYSLREVTIPDSVTSIGSNAFTACSSLREITIPNGVTSIGNSAFSSCTSLREVTIPDSVTSIGSSAFYGCYTLREITIPDSVTSIENNMFYNCYTLREITIPDSVTSIGSSAFYGCYTLREVTIPDSVTSIGTQAFQYCYTLREVTIPDSVTSIGNSAFQYCYSVGEYHFEATTPPTLGTSAFNGIQGDCKIYVPTASVQAYKEATNWSNYANYIYGE